VSAKASTGIALLFADLAAFRATLGLVLQAFFLVKSLFAFCEYEFFVAVFANQSLVGHVGLLSLFRDLASRVDVSRNNQGTDSSIVKSQ
jgi:hypothetical protein